MKGFTEDEKIIAKNIDREYEWLARDSDGNLYVYEGKPRKDECSWYSDDYDCLFYFNHLFPAIKWEDEEPTRITSIYMPPAVLTDSEQEYLKAVFKPFKDEIQWVRLRFYGEVADGQPCRLSAYLRIEDNSTIPPRQLDFPGFIYHKDGMYSDMIPFHDYTLEDLGIYY